MLECGSDGAMCQRSCRLRYRNGSKEVMTTIETRHSTSGLLVGATVSVLTTWIALRVLSIGEWARAKKQGDKDVSAYESLIAQGTPMVFLSRLSRLTKRRVYVKMENMNPGGTGKDRAALAMIRTAERQGLLPTCESKISRAGTVPLANDVSPLQPPELHEALLEAIYRTRTGGIVVEGTSGSTGIALANLSRSRGHACLVVLPDDQAVEKQNLLRLAGALVHVVPTASIASPQHYVNVAKRVADYVNKHALDGSIKAIFTNQFENTANANIHYTVTGPEIFSQCPKLGAFCMSSGTGGTLAGVSKFLKEQRSGIRTVLIDPPGSALFHKIVHGVAYAPQLREHTLKRHRYDTIAEGIGLDRVTNNMRYGLDCIDTAVQVSDQEAVDMAHWLWQYEGLWVGSSSAMNVVGAVRTALSLPEDALVVTVICDHGSRHATRFWNRAFCEDWGLIWPTEQDKRIPACLLD